MESTNVTPTQTEKKTSWHPFGLALLCFVASFLGAWVFVGSGLAGEGHGTTTIQESRQRVISEGEVVTDIAKQVSPSVVSIVTETTQVSDFFGSRTFEGAGTGIVISKDGYILTNKHVLPEGRSSVSVVDAKGKTHSDVRVVGRDPLNDIAFLKVNGVSDMTPAQIGDSSEIVVGQKVVAIGNALGQFDATVTSGIISGTNRSVQAAGANYQVESLVNLLQTDAAINPGNSGGPLVNISGEVIGVNTAVSEDAEGIGFAIPINDAKGLIRGVLDNGSVERSYIGVRYLMITPDVQEEYNLDREQGAYIIGSESQPAVMDGSPADKAGLESGDIIVKVDGNSIDKQNVLLSQLSQYVPDEKITITFIRDGKERTASVTLEQLN